MEARFDARVLKDLALDTGSAESDLSSNTRVTAALTDASGKVDAVCRQGGRYTTSDLSGLTGNSLGLLKNITCGLAVGQLAMSRGLAMNDNDGWSAAYQQALDWLNLLGTGQEIFDLAHAERAGQPKSDGPTSTQLNDANLAVRTSRRYFGTTTNLPQSR